MYLSLFSSSSGELASIKVLKDLVLLPDIVYTVPIPCTPKMSDVLSGCVKTLLIGGITIGDNFMLYNGTYHVIISATKTTVLPKDNFIVEYKGAGLKDVSITNPTLGTELTDNFFERLNDLIGYWSKDDEEVREKLESFCFSMLVEMDGGGSSSGFELSGYGCFESAVDGLVEQCQYTLPNTLLYGDGALHELWYPFLDDVKK